MMETAGSLAVEARGVSTVRQVPAARADLALAHFAGKAAFETDCADVHAAFASGKVDFVLLDVRGPDAYRKGHIAGAISIPRRTISEEAMKGYAADTLFVVYCAGPHCRGRCHSRDQATVVVLVKDVTTGKANGRHFRKRCHSQR